MRYADPDPHLRVRWQGNPSHLAGPFLREMCSWARDLVREGMCDRFSIETYERELERYGGPAGMDAAESLFCADSSAVAQVLAGRRTGAVTHNLVTTAVVTVDDRCSTASATTSSTGLACLPSGPHRLGPAVTTIDIASLNYARR